MEDCIFCQIAAGKIPSAKVYEDEEVYAFLDLGQVTKGHTLVIPKEHARNMFDLPEETAAALFKRIPKIANALKETLPLGGMNILNNNEEVASQSVFHCHIHLIPRYSKEDGFGLIWHSNEDDFNNEEAQKLAAEINQRLV